LSDGLLEGKVALVTGGDSGVGRGVCVELSRLGAEVILTGNHVGGLDSWYRELSSEGGPVSGFESDPLRAETISELVDEIETVHGRLDILVTFSKPLAATPALDVDPDDWRRSVACALEGVFVYCKAMQPLLARKGGVIANLFDVSGRTGIASSVMSGSPAAGVENLTQTLAVEWGPLGIRVVGVALGSIDTSAYERCPWEASENGTEGVRMPQVPIGRLGTPREVGQIVAFLTSDAAGFVTGATLRVDGGQSLRTMHP
jgi:NAD(P)-dependent dehydrogenase (short-subunit alcohol dehydrogenase family)